MKDVWPSMASERSRLQRLPWVSVFDWLLCSGGHVS